MISYTVALTCRAKSEQKMLADSLNENIKTNIGVDKVPELKLSTNTEGFSRLSSFSKCFM